MERIHSGTHPAPSPFIIQAYFGIHDSYVCTPLHKVNGNTAVLSFRRHVFSKGK